MRTLGCGIARLSFLAASVSALALAATPAVAQQVDARSFDIPTQPLSSALLEFSKQADVMVVVEPSLTEGKRSPALKGTMPVNVAMGRLLQGTKLHAVPSPSGGYVVSAEGNAFAGVTGAATEAQSVSSTGEGAADTQNDKGIAEILVVGKKSLNVDIRRTRNDIQPYVVLDAQELSQSGATTVDDFLRTRLPMNTQVASPLQNSDLQGSQAGQINLRGLGTDQTLVLVDGRRMPGIALGDSFGQPSISGIPPSAVDRVEVLPSTASGIYGGGATGGVVNVILKHDYSGIDFQARYGNTFDTDTSYVELALNGGFHIHHLLQIDFSVTHSESGTLLTGDRDFYSRGAEAFVSQNATSPFFPYYIASVAGSLSNVVSLAGPLVLDDGTPIGSTFTSVPAGYRGAASDSGAGLVSQSGKLNTDVRTGNLYQAPILDAQSLGIRGDLTSWLSGFININHSTRRDTASHSDFTVIFLDASSPNNPFQGPVNVGIPLPWLKDKSERDFKSTQFTSGLILQLGRGWGGSLEYNRGTAVSEVRTSVAGAPTPQGQAFLERIAFNDPSTIDIPADPASLFSTNATHYGPAISTLSDATLRFSGPLFQTWAGKATASGYIEHQENKAHDVFSDSAFGLFSQTIWTPPASQNISSAYLETRIPLAGGVQSTPFLHELEVMASVRFDKYQTRFAGQQYVASRSAARPDLSYSENDLSSGNFTIGAKYAPVKDITFRASYGTGFRPPPLGYVYETTAVQPAFYYSFYTDPLRGNTPLIGDSNGFITVSSGGNSSLRPEKSKSLSVGMILKPHFIPGLRFSIDYTSIRKIDEFVNPTIQELIDHETAFATRIQRGPNLVTDQPGWAGPITFIDGSALNIAASHLRAVDLQLDYNLSSAIWGNWRLYGVGTRTLELSQVRFPGDSVTQLLGYYDGPLKWRGNFGLDWNKGPWSAGWNAQYFGSYSTLYSFAPNDTAGSIFQYSRLNVRSQMYHDIYVQYQVNAKAGLLSDINISASIQNVFNTEPPILGQRGYSNYGDPRLRRFTITLRKHIG